MNRLTFRRFAGTYSTDVRVQVDLAVPVIDGVALHERVGERFVGLDTSLVASPSRHLLGSPEYVVEGRTVLLDGGCFIADCCGVAARVTVGERMVVWDDFFARGTPDVPDNLSFTFDRASYEAALAALSSLEPEPMPRNLPG